MYLEFTPKLTGASGRLVRPIVALAAVNVAVAVFASLSTL
jgi:hypothetical protein